MKKKILKRIFIVLIVLAVLYFIYSAITAKIYFDIYSEMKNKVNSEKDFYAKIEQQVSEEYQITQEVFLKDNVYVKVLQRSNKENTDVVTLKLWQNHSPNDSKGYIFIESSVDDTKHAQVLEYKEFKEPEDKMYRYQLAKSLVLGNSLTDFSEYVVPEYTYSKILLGVMKHPTIIYSTEFNGEKCYAIKYLLGSGGVYLFSPDERIPDFLMYFYALFNTSTEYISKETKLPIGVYMPNAQPNTTNYSYFTKDVTEEDIKMPNLEEYEVIE